MSNHTATTGRPVYIVDGLRTPFLKAKDIGPYSAADLAVYAARALLTRLPIDPTDLDEVIMGCMAPSENEANIARIIALRLGCGKTVPAFTVQRNCASGMQALDDAFKDITLGRHDLVLAGGTEVMSRAPLIYNVNAVRWFGKMMKSKSLMQRMQLFLKLPLGAFLKPTIALLKGLTDPLYKVGMGQTAEIVATRFNITRQEMDEFSCQSHLKAAKAFDQGYMRQEIAPIIDEKGNIDEVDTGLRKDSTVVQLGKLKPMFDKVYGRVTAGNSSQVTDGSCSLLLASEDALKKYSLTPLAQIKDIHWAGCDPKQMGLGPVHATTPILQRHQLSLSDIDYWEMNEAFAAQILGCVAAWKSDEYCRTELGLDQALGALDMSRLNIDGGAVALGHPVGASGARIVLHLANVLKRQQAKWGIATICIGGGQGGAMLLEKC